MIYQHLAVVNCAIITDEGAEEVTQLDVVVQGNLRKLRWSLQYPCRHGGSTFTYSSEKRLYPSGFNPSFFGASKQIHQEATNVFYGSNTSRVSSTATLRTFLEAIGTNRTMLRAIQVIGDGHAYPSRTAPECATMLKEAGDLHSLHLDVSCKRYGIRPWKMAKDLAPLMEHLFVYKRGDISEVWKVITFGKDLKKETVARSGAKKAVFGGPFAQVPFVEMLQHEIISYLSQRQSWLGKVKGEGAKQVDHSEQVAEEME